MQHLDMLRRVAAGELAPEEALAMLRAADVAELGGIARLDIGRATRMGIPEVVLAAPKQPAEVAAIATAMLERTGICLISRVRARHRRALEALASERGGEVRSYGRRAVLLTDPGVHRPAPQAGLVGLIAAGTSDLDPLAEASMILDATGVASRTIADVGVAGLHRLFTPLAALMRDGADALVVAAGMDGALASVVAGLAGVPVIGLPTSTGYGAGGGGRAALLAMLQGCAPGLVVVNVDNGVGAGAAAALIAMRRTAPVPAAPRAAIP
jgi:NCAIR mutase (PurE)-related protein